MVFWCEGDYWGLLSRVYIFILYMEGGVKI